MGLFTGVLFCSGVGPFGFVLILDRILSPVVLLGGAGGIFSSCEPGKPKAAYSSLKKHEVYKWLAGVSLLVSSLTMYSQSPIFTWDCCFLKLNGGSRTYSLHEAL